LKFNLLVIFGILFLALGIGGLVHPNIVMPGKKQELQIAGQKVIMETRRVVTVPGMLGVLLILAGGAALFLSQAKPGTGKSRRRS
jgi:hypothetical protein